MKRTALDWVLVTRPWSFPASTVPVLATTAYVSYWCKQNGMDYNMLNSLLAGIMLVLMHAAANLIGDYYDHVHKVDLPGSLNGVHHIHDGIFSPKEVLHYGYALLAIGAIFGIVLLIRTELSAIWIGLLGILLVACYPRLKYNRLGDVDVLLGFALMPALGVCYVMTGHYMWQPMVMSTAFGIITVAILHANNTRDIQNDTRAGISTLSIKLGAKTSQYLYMIEILTAYVLVGILVVLHLIPFLSLIVVLSLPLAYRNIMQMMKAEPLAEKPIATLDMKTAQLQMAFGMLYTQSFVITMFL